jgi:hypothetical protein
MHGPMSFGHYGMGMPWLFMLFWVVLVLPPFWKIFSKAGQDGRGQIGAVHPGQDQKASVVDN